jgi:hypothetical protein
MRKLLSFEKNSSQCFAQGSWNSVPNNFSAGVSIDINHLAQAGSLNAM